MESEDFLKVKGLREKSNFIWDEMWKFDVYNQVGEKEEKPDRRKIISVGALFYSLV